MLRMRWSDSRLVRTQRSQAQQALTVYIFGAAIATMRQILASCLLCILATYPEVVHLSLSQAVIRSCVLP
jgi:hypothetical protein